MKEAGMVIAVALFALLLSSAGVAILVVAGRRERQRVAAGESAAAR